MTSILLPPSMYANAAVQFRDPFAARDVSLDRQPHEHTHPSQRGWSSYNNQHHQHRNLETLTPPRDMNGVSHVTRPSNYYGEHGHHYGDNQSRQQSSRAPVAPYLPQHLSQAEYGASAASTDSRSRTVSPAPHSRQVAQDTVGERRQSRRTSTPNEIVPGLQIPKTVNASGGSLSELAAQITCLFWFESSDLLEQIEKSTSTISLSRPLVKDATPSTGFRKWVTTILSTTLVAQNVVLLALLFVHRLKKMNPTVKGKPGSEYRLLTVALMLGNKFLDDNTYTNKTWAEVSGINVGEVHIMEVEFLSNMKYCLYTSADDWAKWQSLLGKYAAFFDQATHSPPPPPAARPVPILPPASSLNLPMALPSPPASNQASPPYAGDMARHGLPYPVAVSHGPTPAPSPLAHMQPNLSQFSTSRKRSHEDYSNEPPPKRFASGLQQEFTPSPYPAPNGLGQRLGGLTLPSLSIPSGQTAAGSYTPSHGQHLPPLNVPQRAMAMVYPSTSAPLQPSQYTVAGSANSQPVSQYQSRQQSPYPNSAGASPSNSLGPAAAALHPSTQVSPTNYLQQRSSPYKPIHPVSKLMYPPPSGALHHRSQSIEFNQMHYQPLGKPIQQRQTGRLPYVSQNVWLDGDNRQQAMTPVSQWPSFAPISQQRPTSRQQA